MSKSYDVEVVRTSYAFRTIRVQADNEQDAKERACDCAGSFMFDEKTADYTADTATEVIWEEMR